MKNLVRLININDGGGKEHYNGNMLYIESRPRAEKIIAAFLDDGWKLEGCGRRYNPTINKPGVYNFYVGGWELIFTKTVEDDAEDNSDKLLEDVLYKLGCVRIDEDNDDEDVDDEDIDDEDIDDDEEFDYEAESEYAYMDDEYLNYDDN